MSLRTKEEYIEERMARWRMTAQCQCAAHYISAEREAVASWEGSQALDAFFASPAGIKAKEEFQANMAAIERKGSMRARKKPVEVDVFKYEGDSNFNFLREFVGADVVLHRCGDMTLGIPTLEGIIYASPGDWIVRGVKGELYPCKPDVFAMTYELVT